MACTKPQEKLAAKDLDIACESRCSDQVSAVTVSDGAVFTISDGRAV